MAVEEVEDEARDLADEVGANFCISEFIFCLGFKDGVLESDSDGAGHRFADVIAVVFSLSVLVYALKEAFTEGGEVGTAVGGELAIDEGVEGFVVAGGMCEGDFDCFRAVVEGGIQAFAADFLEEEVGQAAGGGDRFTVKEEGEAGMEAGVEAEAAFDEVWEEGSLWEDIRVGFEFDEGTVFLVRALTVEAAEELAAGEFGAGEFSVAVGLDEEAAGECVNGLGADAVESDGELEDVVVIFGAGIDEGNALDDFAEGDSAAEIADRDAGSVDMDEDFAAVAHNELIDGVIDNFLQEDIDSVVVLGTVADSADIHSGSFSDMFEGRKGLDFAFVVDGGIFSGHGGEQESKSGGEKQILRGFRVWGCV